MIIIISELTTRYLINIQVVDVVGSYVVRVLLAYQLTSWVFKCWLIIIRCLALCGNGGYTYTSTGRLIIKVERSFGWQSVRLYNVMYWYSRSEIRGLLLLHPLVLLTPITYKLS